MGNQTPHHQQRFQDEQQLRFTIRQTDTRQKSTLGSSVRIEGIEVMKNLMHKIWNNPKWFSITVVVLSVTLGAGFVFAMAHAFGDVNRQVQTVNESSSQPEPLKSAETTSQEAPEATKPTETHNVPSVRQTTPQTQQKQAPATSQPAPQQPQPLNCPAGTYDAGGFCKNEPTGCPFGDSIPLDSPKCAPPADIECNADWTVCTKKGE